MKEYLKASLGGDIFDGATVEESIA